MDLLTIYRDYLLSINELGADSKGSYYSYLKNAMEQFLNPYVKNKFAYMGGFESLLLGLSKARQEKLLIVIDDMLSASLKGKKIAGPNKTLSNYRSGFRKLLELYYSDGLPSKETVTGKSPVGKKIDQSYKKLSTKLIAKKDLDRIYLSRLKTQDRRYAKLCFPIRLIWSICRQHGKENELKDIMCETLDQMTYYLENGKTIIHKNVVSLDFSKPCILVNGKKKLLTPTSSQTFIEFKGTMRDVSIDHVVALENLLNTDAARNAYPKLTELSDRLVAYLKSRGLKGISAKSSSAFFHLYGAQYDQAFTGELLKEMGQLFALMDFQAMSRRENSSKNKKRMP